MEYDCRLQCPLSAAVVLASYAVQCKSHLFLEKLMINDLIITALNKQPLSHSTPVVSVWLCLCVFRVDAQCLFPSHAAEIGDHCPSRLPGYLSKCHFIPEQDEDFLSKVEDLHPQHK